MMIFNMMEAWSKATSSNKKQRATKAAVLLLLNSFSHRLFYSTYDHFFIQLLDSSRASHNIYYIVSKANPIPQ